MPPELLAAETEAAAVGSAPARHRLPAAIRLTIVRFAQAIGDLLALNAAPWLAAATLLALHGDLAPYFPPAQAQTLAWLHLAIAGSCLGWFWVRLRHYTYRKTYWAELGEILRTLTICAIGQLVLMALFKMQVSRTAWALSWGYALLLVPTARFGIKRLLGWARLWDKPAVIIGTGANALEALDALRNEHSLGFSFQYFVASNDGPAPDAIHGIPVLRDAEALWSLTDPEDTHYFIAPDGDGPGDRDRWVRLTTLNHCRAVSVIPTTRGLPLNSIDASFIFSHDVLILRISENLRRRSARILKRSFDIVGSASLLLILSPVFAWLMFQIGRDGGQPIYGHQRIGRDGRPFRCLKFRTMVRNSKEVLAELLVNDPIARAEWQADFKLRNDPRITRVGAWLRRSSLDELPQLWNVLKGDMSLVGPRPIIEAELARYADDVGYYLMAKPGMTGLWQISGRNDVDYARRVYFDAWYVKNWSLWHDIAILFKTIRVVCNRNGAY